MKKPVINNENRKFLYEAILKLETLEECEASMKYLAEVLEEVMKG